MEIAETCSEVKSIVENEYTQTFLGQKSPTSVYLLSETGTHDCHVESPSGMTVASLSS
jgi:hypothetical protein